MVISDNAKPTINLIGGTPNGNVVNKVAGASRGPVSTILVRSPEGVTERHTAFNARDLIRFHGWKQVSAPNVVNDHPDANRQQTMVESMREIEEQHYNAQAAASEEAPAFEEHDPNKEALSALQTLRSEYKRVLGKDPHPKLGMKKMREEIDAAG